MTDNRPIEYTRRYALTAGETDAQGRMPMWLIITRCIETATEHANILGIGYSTLIKQGIGWVLSRISVNMLRYPTINEEYTFVTWIEAHNRLFSDRAFLITDADGNPVGHARSVWMAIDIEKRTAADLTDLGREAFVIGDRACPLPRQKKIGMLQGDVKESEYTFKFCDIDFYRHVNTVQYVRHILNQWPMRTFDNCEIDTFEIAFNHECHYGDTVTIRTEQASPTAHCEIVREGQRAIAAAITFRPNTTL